MFASLKKLAALPAETQVCCGHEYTEANARFAITVEPNNPDLQARAAEVKRLTRGRSADSALDASAANGRPTRSSVRKMSRHSRIS